jgi:hypothetical protein
MKSPALQTALLALTATALLASPARAAQGTIAAATESDCSDYFVVETDDGYALLEWFAGAVANKGDKVAGTFNQYGMQMIAVLPQGGMMRAYLEDYGLNQDDAQDRLKQKCS